MTSRKGTSAGAVRSQTRKMDTEQWLPKSSSLYIGSGPGGMMGDAESQNAGPTHSSAFAQQLLMLLPGANSNGRGAAAADLLTPANGETLKRPPPLPATLTIDDEPYRRASNAMVPPIGLPPGAAAELGALLFADVVRKQLMEQVSKANGGGPTMMPAMTESILGLPPPGIGAQSLDLYRQPYPNNGKVGQPQHSPMILSPSDIANKAPLELANNKAGHDSPRLAALQYDAFPGHRFGNHNSFVGLHAFSERATTSSAPAAGGDEQDSSSSSVVEVDARALLAAFLHCLTSEMKSDHHHHHHHHHPTMSANNSAESNSTPPRSLGESDEDAPPKTLGGGKLGKQAAASGRGSQRRTSSVYSASDTTCASLYLGLGVSSSVGDNGSSPNGSSGTHNSSCNSSTSSTSSSKRSAKANSSGAMASPEHDAMMAITASTMTASSSAGSSPPANSTGTHGGSGGDSETLIQELVEEATTLKQQQQEAASKLSLNESEPFYWVQSFHAFERRNLIRTCLMQPPTQMTFDPRRQCFRRMPAVTLYRCNVCGDYTSKHRDKISRHLTLQHSIKPTSPPPTSPGNSTGGSAPSTHNQLIEKVSVGGSMTASGDGAEIDMAPMVETATSSSNSSPTWSSGNSGQQKVVMGGQSSMMTVQWPPMAAANSRLPLAITTDPKALLINNGSNGSQSAAMDLTNSTIGQGVLESQQTRQPQSQMARNLLTVGGMIETAFYKAAGSSSSPSPPLSPINEESCSSSPAKKIKSQQQQLQQQASNVSDLAAASDSMTAVNLSGISNGDGAFQRFASSAATADNRQREFPCHYCPATFRLYVALRTHYAQCHPSSKPYTCAVNSCTFSTSQLRKLNQHHQQHQLQLQQQQQPTQPRPMETAQKI